MYKRTVFISKAEAEDFCEPTNQGNRILISITSPAVPNSFTWAAKPAVLHDNSWLDVLRLEFDDVDPSHMNPQQAAMFRLFNEEDAAKIIEFLQKYSDVVEDAVVHCEAGISRSAAVSKFIAYTNYLQFPEDYNLYNKHVYGTLMRVQGSTSK